MVHGSWFFPRGIYSMLSLNLLPQRSSLKPQAEWLLHRRSAEPCMVKGKGYGDKGYRLGVEQVYYGFGKRPDA